MTVENCVVLRHKTAKLNLPATLFTFLQHIIRPSVNKPTRQYFHMHLISDATGETLNTVARAAAAHYADFQPLEHIYADAAW